MKTDQRPEPDDCARLRVPPHSLEGEQSVLGGLLLDNGAWDRVGDLLVDSDFYRYEHRLIYATICGLIATCKPADVITVFGALQAQGKDGECGGLPYLNSLAQSVPSAANARRYAEIVRERALLRKMIAVGDEITTRGFNPGGQTAMELLDAAGAQVYSLSESGAAGQAGPVRIDDLVVQVLDRVQEMADKGGTEVTGVPTGFTDLDKVLCGLQGGDLVVLAARPSMGKTSFALNIAEHVAVKEQLPVVVFSMEMGAAQLALKMVGSLGKIQQQHLRKGTLNDFEWGDLTRAVDKLRLTSIFIDESPALGAGEIRARARRLARQCGKLGLIVIDYLQLMAGAAGEENRATEIGAITRALKGLAKELDCPVVALSQLNRSVEQRTDKRPMMSDLRECLPVDEWVDTPTGPVQIGTRPDAIITATERGAMPAACSFIEKRYNSVYRVSTKFGAFSATARHLVLTGVGWKQVRDLKPGRDVVACPKKIEHANQGQMPHARLLGWLLGNGCLTGTPGLIYRNELDADVRDAVRQFGVEVRPRKCQKAENVIDAYLSNGRETGCTPNPLMTWVRSLGLEGKTAYDKSVPAQYMGSSDGTHRELLRGLWETDGTVTGGTGKYATCNEVLARQVKWLLHTVGIRATLGFSQNGHAGMWEVRCAVEDNERLALICGDLRRFSPLAACSPHYIDPAPAIFVELLSEIYTGKERLQRRDDGQIKQISKERMRAMLADCEVATINSSPYMRMEYMGWAPVTQVEAGTDDVRVCDLTVPGTHSFLTNGLVVHNSGAIEQDADIIMFIYRDDYYNKQSLMPGEAEIIVAKNRNGPTGTVRLVWLKTMTKFDNLAKDYQRPSASKSSAPDVEM